MPDNTHDPNLRSWIESANVPTTDFSIQNIPFGVFTRDDIETPRIGVAIGESVLDVTGCVEARLLENIGPEGCCAMSADSLNAFMGHGRSVWTKARQVLVKLLSSDTATLRDDPSLRERLVVPAGSVQMLMPARIGDYTDFYASLHHATNVGSMFRPDNPLLPNYKHLPVGYHGRAGSIVPSGAPVRRPMGQVRPDDAKPPTYGPCRLLDYELELGVFVGPGNAMGTRIDMGAATDHLFGMCILNDWSARDVQKWEYQPLGPFNAKNFATTISPWVVTLDALEPFRVPGPPRGADDPEILDYLKPTEDLGLDITVEVWLRSPDMRSDPPSLQGRGPGGGLQSSEASSIEVDSSGAMLVSRGTFKDMYWTIAQMLVHHASTGCNMRPGDLFASGTVSGPDEGARGCLLERTWRGQNPIDLPDGTQRKFLQDGDEVIIRAYCEREGAARIGFGECSGVILPVQ